MLKLILRSTVSASLLGIAMLAGLLIDQYSNDDDSIPPMPEVIIVGNNQGAVDQSNAALQETIPPNTPLPTLTPSVTLKPPPTFEPPTMTPTASMTPTITPSPTSNVVVDIPGLNGLNSPTPDVPTPECEPREDWGLTYTVQRDDAIANIAAKYGTYADTLAQGNCLKDKNLISIGQVLRVPGEAPPYQPSIDCIAFELLTPANNSSVPADGMVTFNWRGPLAPKNMIRIVRPDGSIYEETIEFRQNQQINASEEMTQEGTYTWYVFPLNEQGNTIIDCTMGGAWTFSKTTSGS